MSVNNHDRKKARRSLSPSATLTASSTSSRRDQSKINIMTPPPVKMQSNNDSSTSSNHKNTTATKTTSTIPLFKADETKKWHKYRSDISDPIFCDTTATISALKFGSRRLPEIKDLWYSTTINRNNKITTSTTATKTSSTTTNNNNNSGVIPGINFVGTGTKLIQAYRSSGRKTSSCRHLRRRVGAFQNKRNRYRSFPNSSSSSSSVVATTTGTTNKTNRNTNKTAPSRRKQRKNKTILSQMKHEHWRIQTPQQTPQEQYQQQLQFAYTDTKLDTTSSVSDRLPTIECSNQIVSNDENSTNNNNNNNNNIDDPKLAVDDKDIVPIVTATNTTTTTVSKFWMMTHIWHTKRFHMSTEKGNNCTWGWSVPMLHINRGTQATIRLLSGSNSKRSPTTRRKNNDSHHNYPMMNELTLSNTDTNNNNIRTTNTTKNDDNDGTKCTICDATWQMQPIWYRYCFSSNDTTNNNDTNHIEMLEGLWKQCIPEFTVSSCTNINSAQTHNNPTDQSFMGSEGMMYHRGQYPLGAIGPISWICSQVTTESKSSLSTSETTTPTSTFENNEAIAASSLIGSGRIYDDKYVEIPINQKSTPVMTTTNCSQIDKREQKLMTTVTLYFFVHPSIQDEIIQEMKKICIQNGPAEFNNVCGPTIGLHGGISCLQLRGENSHCIVGSMLSTGVSTNRVADDDNNSSTVDPVSHSDKEGLSSSFVNKTDSFVSFNKWNCQSVTENKHLSVWSEIIPEMGDSRITIKRICPRDSTMVNNYGVCGYNIFCDPNYTKELFLKIVLKNGACPVGYADEAYIAIHCSPPIPVFPRDYPDTVEGQKYWNGTSIEWNYIRQYWDGGGGRIRCVTSTPSVLLERGTNCRLPNFVTPANFHLDGSSEQPNIEVTETLQHTEGVAVVRGSLVLPFQQCLDFVTTISSINGSCSKKRRRPSNKCQSFFALAPLVSKSKLRQHKSFIESLLSSLTLPAVLLCEIRIIGKGRLCPLYTIHTTTTTTTVHTENETTSSTNNLERHQLGYVTSGCFSVFHGQYCGLGIITAKSFLQTICSNVNRCIQNPQQSKIVIVGDNVSLTTRKKVGLLVVVKNQTGQEYNATLILI